MKSGKKSMLLLLSVLPVLLTSCASKQPPPKDGECTISVSRPTVQTLYKDKMYYPQGSGCGRAYTFWSFDCYTEFNIVPVKLDPQNGTAVYRINGLRSKLGLKVTQWLPFFVSQKIREHENCHVELTNYCYEKAQQIGMECAKSVVGTEVVVNNIISPTDADQKAAQQAHLAFCLPYRARTNDVADRLNAEFDELTNHGMNEKDSKVTLEKIIKEARAEKSNAATTTEAASNASASKATLTKSPNISKRANRKAVEENVFGDEH